MNRWYVLSCVVLAMLVACEAEPVGDDSPSTAVNSQPKPSTSNPAPATVESDADFAMPIADVFSISGKGVVITGQVRSGSVSVGDAVCLSSGIGPLTVDGIEVFRKVVDSATAGMNVGLLLSGLAKGDAEPGAMVTTCD